MPKENCFYQRLAITRSTLEGPYDTFTFRLPKRITEAARETVNLMVNIIVWESRDPTHQEHLAELPIIKRNKTDASKIELQTAHPENLFGTLASSGLIPEALSQKIIDTIKKENALSIRSSPMTSSAGIAPRSSYSSMLKLPLPTSPTGSDGAETSLVSEADTVTVQSSCASCFSPLSQ